MAKRKMRNILLLSVGTRNKIIQYFKNAFQGAGNVIATDRSSLAPALYEADKFYIVPGIDSPNYIDIVLEICIKEDISGVLSLIDPELSLLSENKSKFESRNIMVIGSPYNLCEMALDKMQMYYFCSKNGFRCAGSYSDITAFRSDIKEGKITFPVFVKPICGSASVAISKVSDQKSVDFLLKNSEEPLMIQEYLKGQEIGADCYIDMISGELVSIFTKKKISMRAGETDKAVSFKNPQLFAEIERFIKCAGFRGQIDIDIFEIDGNYYISEVNPRFGGGYPHAYECGVDHMTYILNNMEGKANSRDIGTYDDGIYMMKYNEVKMLNEKNNYY